MIVEHDLAIVVVASDVHGRLSSRQRPPLILLLALLAPVERMLPPRTLHRGAGSLLSSTTQPTLPPSLGQHSTSTFTTVPCRGDDGRRRRHNRHHVTTTAMTRSVRSFEWLSSPPFHSWTVWPCGSTLAFNAHVRSVDCGCSW